MFGKNRAEAAGKKMADAEQRRNRALDADEFAAADGDLHDAVFTCTGREFRAYLDARRREDDAR